MNSKGLKFLTVFTLASYSSMHATEVKNKSIEVSENTEIDHGYANGAGLSPENFRQIVIQGTSKELLEDQRKGFPETIKEIKSHLSSNPDQYCQQANFDIETYNTYEDRQSIEFWPSGIVEYVSSLTLSAWSVSWITPCIKYKSLKSAHEDYWRIVKRAGNAKIYIECMFDGTYDFSKANDYKVVSEYWNGFTPKFARQNFSF